MVSGSFTPLGPIGDTDWQRIELAYGQPLSESVREAIFRVTQNYVLFDATERQAEPVANGEKLISAYKKAAKNLVSEMQKGSPSDAATYAQQHIKNHFEDRRLSSNNKLPSGVFVALLGVLITFEAACAGALRDLQKTAVSSVKAREWERWIWQLIKIVQSHSLPDGVRKDGEGVSSFVALVRELQNCLPTECKLPYADSALPTAIARAKASRVA
jgi:hypothetical protein